MQIYVDICRYSHLHLSRTRKRNFEGARLCLSVLNLLVYILIYLLFPIHLCASLSMPNRKLNFERTVWRIARGNVIFTFSEYSPFVVTLSTTDASGPAAPSSSLSSSSSSSSSYSSMSSAASRPRTKAYGAITPSSSASSSSTTTLTVRTHRMGNGDPMHAKGLVGSDACSMRSFFLDPSIHPSRDPSIRFDSIPRRLHAWMRTFTI